MSGAMRKLYNAYKKGDLGKIDNNCLEEKNKQKLKKPKSASFSS